MKVIYLIVGFIAAIFLLPAFVQILHSFATELDAKGISNPSLIYFLTFFYTVIPYVILAVIIIAAFLVARGSRNG